MATKGSTRAFLAANVAAAGLVGLAAYAVSTYLATENKESWPPAQNLSPPQETLVRPRTRAPRARRDTSEDHERRRRRSISHLSLDIALT